MSVTDTEILALRARKFSIVRIAKQTGAPSKRVRRLLAKHGMLGERRRDPKTSEMRVHVEVMHAELKSLRLLVAGQAQALDQIKGLIGALALDLTDPVAGDDLGAPALVPPLPAHRPRLSRTSRALAAERPILKAGAA